MKRQACAGSGWPRGRLVTCPCGCAGVTLDLYCERLGPGLLAEPVNAVTNAAFLLAGFWTLRRARGDRGVVLLGVLTLAIGAGSTLFHTLATPLALLADVLPILLFQLVFLALYLQRRTALPASQVPWWVAAFFGLTLLGRQQPQLLNGSLAYAPALLVLLALGLREWRRQGPLLVICAALFALSLLLRSVDLVVCPWLPLGTHPLWHLLNAVVLAGVSLALLARPAAAS